MLHPSSPRVIHPFRMIYLDSVGFTPIAPSHFKSAWRRLSSVQIPSPVAQSPNAPYSSPIYLPSANRERFRKQRRFHDAICPSTGSGPRACRGEPVETACRNGSAASRRPLRFQCLLVAAQDRAALSPVNLRRPNSSSLGMIYYDCFDSPTATALQNGRSTLIWFDSLNAQRGSAPWIVAERSLHGGRSLKFTLIAPPCHNLSVRLRALVSSCETIHKNGRIALIRFDSSASTSLGPTEAGYSIRPRPPSGRRQNASKNGRITLIALIRPMQPPSKMASSTLIYFDRFDPPMPI
jgi:hypothetical protein